MFISWKCPDQNIYRVHCGFQRILGNCDGVQINKRNNYEKNMFYLQIVDDVIKMTVTEKGQDGQHRNYTFSQLEDLQSRLMLVAGKSDTVSGKGSERHEKKTEVDVERFTMVNVFYYLLFNLVKFANILSFETN